MLVASRPTPDRGNQHLNKVVEQYSVHVVQQLLCAFRSKTELWEKKGGWPNEKSFHHFLPQPVSPRAMQATASARVDQLAEFRSLPKDFQPEKPVRYLAYPIIMFILQINEQIKIYQKKFILLIFESKLVNIRACFCTAKLQQKIQNIWKVESNHKFLTLFIHTLFRWLVSEEALKLNASMRLCQLARPRSRTILRDDNFDPYLVSRAARYAQITPRIEELAVPQPRKQRSKRVAV